MSKKKPRTDYAKRISTLKKLDNCMKAQALNNKVRGKKTAEKT